MGDSLQLYGVYLFVGDMTATLDFYRRLGLAIEEVSEMFARAELESGINIEFGTAELTGSYDRRWSQPPGPGTNTINFELASRDAVDAMYDDLTASGHGGHMAPIDAIWGARFALLDDPDGNVVGLHSPRDRERERANEAGSTS
jgi:predicted enzyme related to lactoylglutathione lyase